MFRSRQKGFTLVETLVAIFVFSIAATSLLTVLSRGIFATREATNTTTASFLAQEGIELIELVRYGNFLEKVQPAEDILPECLTSCYADPGEDSDSTALIIQCSGECPVMDIDSDGRYGYNLSNAEESRFRRTISVDSVDNSDRRFTVTSKVEWLSGNVTRQVQFVKQGTLWINPLSVP